jgi:3-oxoacyl-[acyl-carrier-protein] synthase-3
VKAAILGTGYYVPTKIVTNDDLSKTLDTSDEWIYSHTGIKNRRIAAEDEAASDLGTHAAKSALQNAGIDPNEVDMILVATTSPDYNSFPSTASIIQDKIGASKAGAMDLSAACTGFVYAMETARAFIEAGSSRYILVIGTEVFSRILNWEDRNTCILFGDAAGAVLVGPSKNNQTPILSKQFYAQTEAEPRPSAVPWEALRYQSIRGSSDLAPTLVYMDGRTVYNFAVKVVKDMIIEILGPPRKNCGRRYPYCPPPGQCEDHPSRLQAPQGTHGKVLHQHGSVCQHQRRFYPPGLGRDE